MIGIRFSQLFKKCEPKRGGFEVSIHGKKAQRDTADGFDGFTSIHGSMNVKNPGMGPIDHGNSACLPLRCEQFFETRKDQKKNPAYYTVLSFKRLYQLRFLTIELWKDATGARRHWTGWIRGMTKQLTCWKRNFHQEFWMARGQPGIGWHWWFQSCDNFHFDHTSTSHQRQKVVVLWILRGGVWNPEISEIFL